MLTSYLTKPNHNMNTRKDIPDIGKIFTEMFNPPTQSHDISETSTQYTIELTVPGYKKNEIEIDIVSNMLVVKGENKRPALDYTYKSITYGEFVQKFTLPDNVGGEIKAKLEDGILKITIPKSEKGRSKIRID